MVDKAITLAVVLTLILVFGLQMLLFALPFFQRMSFDAACHRALMAIDHAGGLTDSIRLRLEQDLQDQGLDEIAIHGDVRVPFGQPISLEVLARLQVHLIRPSFQMEREPRMLRYQNTVLSRRLWTEAGEPG
jgi:hypothetical protein